MRFIQPSNVKMNFEKLIIENKESKLDALKLEPIGIEFNEFEIKIGLKVVTAQFIKKNKIICQYFEVIPGNNL